MFKPVPKKPEDSFRVAQKTNAKRPYSPPAIKTINAEQAILTLVELAWSGDEQASDFLKLLFPMPEPPTRKSPEGELDLAHGQIGKAR